MRTVPKLVNEATSMELANEVTEEEVRTAVFQLGSLNVFYGISTWEIECFSLSRVFPCESFFFHRNQGRSS